MKAFEISITYRTQGGQVIPFHERLEADSLIELLAKFQITIGKVSEAVLQEELTQQQMRFGQDDDIPF